MRVMIVEFARNGIALAERIVEADAAHEVLLVSSRPMIRPVPRITPIADSRGVTGIVEAAKHWRADVALNYSAILGFGGLLERLEECGIACAGTTRELAESEIRKATFKRWLNTAGFNTPETLFHGALSDAISQRDSFDFPVVIKPDVQAGPAVAVCATPAELVIYGENAIQRYPNARGAYRFAVERYVAIREDLHVGYYICGGAACADISVRLASMREGGRYADECPIASLRHPRNAVFRPEIDRFMNAMAIRAPAALAAVQCAVDVDGTLHFIEHNARPGTNGGALTAFEDPIEAIDCLIRRDASAIAKKCIPIDQGVEIGVALRHAAESIQVDLPRLRSLPGVRVFPTSISFDGSRFVSTRHAEPSILTVAADSASELRLRLSELLPEVRACGDFMPIREASLSLALGD